MVLAVDEAADADEELLEQLSLTQLAQGLGVTVIEVLVADEDVVVDRLGVVEVRAKQVRIHGDVDVAEQDFEPTASPPF